MSAKILVVDDNPTNLKLVSVVLEFEGYDILKAMDAEEAQVVLAATLPDLILMDIALPGMDGLTLTSKLKAEERTRGIRIVALTAFAMKGDDQKAFDAGCDGYIPKPIDTRKLPDQVAGFLARASGQSRRSRLKILVIEDHAVDLKLADLVLSTGGHDVSAVEAAEPAFAAIQKTARGSSSSTSTCRVWTASRWSASSRPTPTRATSTSSLSPAIPNNIRRPPPWLLCAALPGRMC